MTPTLPRGTATFRLVMTGIVFSDIAHTTPAPGPILDTTDSVILVRDGARAAEARVGKPTPGKIESSIDLPHQMIFGHYVIELKVVEKLRLFALQPSHHGLPPPRFASARWNHGRRKPQRTSATKSTPSRRDRLETLLRRVRYVF